MYIISNEWSGWESASSACDPSPFNSPHSDDAITAAAGLTTTTSKARVRACGCYYY